MGALAVVVPAQDPPDVDRAERALRAAPHRGSATETVTCGGAVLGIVNDPSFVDAWLAAQNGRAAVLAGSLDNKREVDAALVRDGHPAPGPSPADTVLSAFGAWGDDAVDRLRGVLAGAVVDEHGVRLFRDHLGLAPLFHRASEEGFVAATEPKQVAAGANFERRPDRAAVEAMFFGRFDSTWTMLEGVSRFPRASIAVLDAEGEPAFRRYWDPGRLLETARVTLPEAREGLAERLETAVRRSLTGNDVVSLSGGIDSPTIAAVAAPIHLEIGGRPLLALSSVYPDLPSVDESRYIELVAERLELPLHTYRPSARPLDDLEHWVDVLDGPVDTMSIPELAESYRRARDLGVDTVLSGEMAEWVFTFGQHLIGHLVLRGRVRASFAWLRDQRARGASWRRVVRRAGPSLTPAWLATRYLRLRRRDFRHLPPWVDRAYAGDPGPRPDLARPASRRWLDAQLDPLGGVGSYSFDADALCAAYCGVHVRRPLADIDLWEYVLTLPAEIKFPNALPKSLLRETVRGRVPDEILDRTDKTFFDAFALEAFDYDVLRRWTVDSEVQLDGVDYGLLAARLEQRSLGVPELMWAYDLARAHAFLGLWR